MASLPNYLLTNRKRLSLSQEEVAFLLGLNGEGKGSKVSRNEYSIGEPSLHTALAYEIIYGKPVSELFAGLYEQIEGEISGRAKVLSHRTAGKLTPKRQETIARLVSKVGN